jgi:hypothetical protein
MIIKTIFSIILLSLYSNCYATFASGLAVGAAISSSNSGNNETFISRKFDYVIACDLENKKINTDIYKYFCLNFDLINDDEILFMSTVFKTDHWPSKIIYYMKRK